MTTVRFEGHDIAERIDELVNPSRARRRREKRLVNPGNGGCCCDAEDVPLDPVDTANLHRWLHSRSIPETLPDAHPIVVARWLEPEITRWFNLHTQSSLEGPHVGFVESPEETGQNDAPEAERAATASPEALFVFHPLTGRQEPIGAAPTGVSSPTSYERLVDLERLRRRT